MSSIVILLVLPTLLGVGILGPVWRRWKVFGVEGVISLSFLLGCFVLGSSASLMLRYGVALSASWSWTLGMLGAGIGSYELLKQRHMYQFKQLNWSWSRICAYSLIAAGLLLNVGMPVMEWDAIALYDFRARIFADGLVIEDLQSNISDIAYFRYYYAYPLMSSVLHAWGYLWGLERVLVLYSGFYAAVGLLLLDVASMRKRSNGMLQWLAVGCLTTPLLLSHTFIAYTNLMYAAFFLAAIVTAFVGMRERHDGWVGFSVVMILASILTRLNEPFYLGIMLAVLLYFAMRKRWLWAIGYGLLIVGLRKWWSDYAVFDDALSVGSVGVVFEQFSLPFFVEVEMFLVSRYVSAIKSALVLALLALVLRVWKRRSLPIYWMVFWVICGGLLTVGGFFFALQMSFWKDISGSAERMMIAFVPVIYFWVIEMFATIWEDEKA